MEQKPFRYRLIALGGLFVLCLIGFLATMADAQLVHGDDYRAQSVRTNTTTETVKASRGILTDRNGKVLVSNRTVYTLEFDASLVGEDELGDAVTRLLELLRGEGLVWNDLLPLAREYPYDYELTASRTKTLLKYLGQEKLFDGDGLDQNSLPDALTPVELLTALRTHAGFDGLSLRETRELVGFLYSLGVSEMNGAGPFVFISDADIGLISRIKDGRYAGVRIGTGSRTVYETDAAAHLLGRVTKIPAEWLDGYLEKGYAMDDLIGRDGAEYAFEEYLRGVDGKRLVTMNADGKITGEVYSVEPQPGGTVALTLDIDFQQDVENILARATDAMTADDGIERGAAAAVVQVGTGDVLAAASYPTYRLRTFNEDFADLNTDPQRPMLNRATMWALAPGSTFKPCVAVAALETGAITPQTKILTKGQYHYYDMVYNCWIYSTNRGSHGLINVTTAIKVSCNYFFYDVGRMTGISTLARYAAAFGLGEPTGIEIPEVTGSMTTPDYVNSLETHRWTDGLTLQAAIGQAYDLFTPLQLANYIATLAGGGTRYPAHLLKDVRDSVTHELISTYDEPPVETVAISDENLYAVLEGMHQLTTSGSVSAQFKNCVVDAGAKTGTAQTGSRKSNGVFVCFAPYDDPQIAVAIAIEKGGSGGALADAAVEILNAYFTSADSNSAAPGENILLK